MRKIRAARKMRAPMTAPAMAPAGGRCVERDAADAEANEALVVSAAEAEVEVPWEELRVLVYTTDLVEITVEPEAGGMAPVRLVWERETEIGEEGSAGSVTEEMTVSGGMVGPGRVTCTVVGTTCVETAVETWAGIVDTTVTWFVVVTIEAGRGGRRSVFGSASLFGALRLDIRSE